MYNNIIVFLFTKNIFFILTYIADMAILTSDFDNFDIDQMSSNFAQRQHFVYNLHCKKISFVGSLDNAENAILHFFIVHLIYPQKIKKLKKMVDWAKTYYFFIQNFTLPPAPRMSSSMLSTWNFAWLKYLSNLQIWATGFDSQIYMEKNY